MSGTLRRWRRRRAPADSGMVTAEMAAALPILVVVSWAALLAISVAHARIMCVDAAREAALAASVGDQAVAQQRAEAAVGGHRVVVAISSDGPQTRVTARMAFRLPGIPTDVSIAETTVASAG